MLFDGGKVDPKRPLSVQVVHSKVEGGSGRWVVGGGWWAAGINAFRWGLFFLREGAEALIHPSSQTYKGKGRESKSKSTAVTQPGCLGSSPTCAEVQLAGFGGMVLS